MLVLYGVQVNGTGRSLNIIQHKRLAFRRQTFIEPLLYIYSYIYLFMLLKYMWQLILVMT